MENENNCNCGNYRIDLKPNQCFCIKVGEYKGYNNAFNLQVRLLNEGYSASIIKTDQMYSVQVGNYDCLETAANVELRLRKKGFNAMVI